MKWHTGDNSIAFGTPTLDATQTNCYSWTRSNVNRLLDLTRLDDFGCYREFDYVSSEVVANRSQASKWYQASGGSKIWAIRSDGQPITYQNTRVLLNTINHLVVPIGQNVSIYVGNEDGTSGIDFEGSQYGAFQTLPFVGTPTARKIAIFENCSFRYSGGQQLATGGSIIGRGVAIDSFYGACWFISCDNSHNISDGFNCHNSRGVSPCVMVTVNCTGSDFGGGPNGPLAFGGSNPSNNAWTLHESAIGADFAGRYILARGGAVKSIGTSKQLMAGTYIGSDLGDLHLGGTTPPSAFNMLEQTILWCYRTKADVSSNVNAYLAQNSAVINLLDHWPTRGAISASGIVYHNGSWA